MMIELLREAIGLVAQPLAKDCKQFKDIELGKRTAFSVKTITVAGPNSGTWSATVVIGTTPDGRGWRPSLKTYEISNSTPVIDDALEISADNWGAWITSFTGDVNLLGTNGWKGINVMVEA